MEEKINTFAGLPNSALSKLSTDENDSTDFSKLRSIEKEFEETNKHTKQGNNTDNTDNTVNNVTESSDSSEPIAKEKKNRLGKLMKGEFAVEMVDMLIPSLVVLLTNYIGYVLEKKDLQLSKSEKEALSPAVQDVLDDINIDFNNPWVNLGVMLSIVYGTKIMDKLPSIKKKTLPIAKKGMAESVAEIIQESGEGGEPATDLEKFEIDYGKLVDEVRLSRKRGVGDAKQYLCENYPEKIKAIAKKHNIQLRLIQDKMQYVHIRKPRNSDIKIPD